MSEKAKSAPSNRGNLALLLEFLGSMNLAIALLVVIAIAATIGTVLQQNQSYPNYVSKFGAFWFEHFKALGLYDVYGAWWFLALLGFLVLSTTICVIRQLPAIIRDINHYRLNVQEKSLRAFHHRDAWQQPADDVTTARARAAARLSASGYRVRERHDEHGSTLAAMKGRSARLGYLLTHIGIVVICLGWIIDGNIPLKVSEALGRVELAKEQSAIYLNDMSRFPAKSVLGPDAASFRGSIEIPEGQNRNFVVLPIRDGYLVQQLPFSVELEDFRVKYYSTGMPKSFESDLVIHDPTLEEPLRQTIAVNHPLIHRGYAFYQSSFGDGGSLLKFRLWSLDRPEQPPSELEGQVFWVNTLDTARGPRDIEFNDLRTNNVDRAFDSEETMNFGPSVVFRVRKPTGEALEYHNFMLPITREGRVYMMSGVRETPNQSYGYLYLPLDDNGRLDRFMHFRALAFDKARLKQAARQAVIASLPADTTAEQLDEISGNIAIMVATFVREGIDRVASDIEARLPKEEQADAIDNSILLINRTLGNIFMDMLVDEGADPNAEITDKDAAFFQDSIEAFASIGPYGSPVFLRLIGFEHVEASVLQITRAPGQTIVYLGCVMLMVGVFLMFYVHHRRVWVRITPAEQGVNILFAGTGHRQRSDFGSEFNRIREQLRTDSGVEASSPQATDRG